MNKCHFLKEISSYLDNQLLEGNKIKLEEHLGKCQACAKELSQLKTLSGKLRQWHLPSLEPSFDSSVKNKIVAWELQGGKVKMKKKTLAILVPSGALAGILVMVFLGNAYFRQGIQGKMRTAQLNPQELATMMKGKAADRISLASLPQSAYEKGIVMGDSTSASFFIAGEQKALGSAVNPKYERALSFDMSRGFETDVERLGTMELSNGVHYDRGSSLEEGNFVSFAKQSPQYARGSLSSNQPTSPRYGSSAGVEYTAHFAGQDSVIVIQPLLPATGVGEMIIRTAELRLEVENGKETYKKISEISQELGGYLAESNFFRDEQGRESGSIILRIPKDKFLTALEKLDTLGKVKDSNTASQDVSQDYANLKSQLDAAKIVYDKMLEALKKRQNTIPEAIKLESELTPVLRRIEVLKNQIERLNNLTSFTTITVNFYESEVSAKVLEDTRQLIKKEMLAAKIRATRWFAQNILFVGSGIGLFVVVVAAIAMLAVWIKQLIKRN